MCEDEDSSAPFGIHGDDKKVLKVSFTERSRTEDEKDTRHQIISHIQNKLMSG